MKNETGHRPKHASGYEAFAASQADAHAALIALGKAVDDGGLEKDLTELVKLRVSQMKWLRVLHPASSQHSPWTGR